MQLVDAWKISFWTGGKTHYWDSYSFANSICQFVADHKKSSRRRQTRKHRKFAINRPIPATTFPQEFQSSHVVKDKRDLNRQPGTTAAAVVKLTLSWLKSSLNCQLESCRKAATEPPIHSSSPALALLQNTVFSTTNSEKSGTVN